MFSGIIEEVGRLRLIEPTRLIIQAQKVLQDIEVKDSIAVDGACLTVTARGEDWFSVDTMPETLRCTRFGSLHASDPVNLERSVAADGRIGGHIVQGHVEATAPVLAVRSDGMALQVKVALPEALQLHVVSKGFIAVNGVSLTVVEAELDCFSFALIPYTQQHTNLGQLQAGMHVNLESDVLGRYVVNFLRQQAVSTAMKTNYVS